MAARKIRIVLIEDSVTVRFFYKGVFEKAGFEVMEAENAQDGWKVICGQKPDIIVLDMLMPRIPGIELLKQIRSVEFSREIPVLVLTSVKDSDQVREMFNVGADHYLLKGMDSPESVKEIVYSLLKKKAEKNVTRALDGREVREADPPAKTNIDQFWWY
jgi:two-component system, OmpR family, phosphate regulon response regulator PhoB